MFKASDMIQLPFNVYRKTYLYVCLYGLSMCLSMYTCFEYDHFFVWGYVNLIALNKYNV